MSSEKGRSLGAVMGVGSHQEASGEDRRHTTLEYYEKAQARLKPSYSALMCPKSVTKV